MDISTLANLPMTMLLLSVLIGGLTGAIFSNKKDNPTKLALALSGSYLFAISILHLIPEAYSTSETHNIGIAILAGFFFQLLLEFFSKGIEHGHTHGHPGNPFPYAIIISLCAHAFTEGLPLGTHLPEETSPLLWAIAIHKIPVAFILTTFLIEGGSKKHTTLLTLLFFALMAPLGSMLSNAIPFFNSNQEYILGVVIGIFLHVSTTILFESSDNHRFNIYKFVTIALGAGLAFLTP